MRVKVTGGATVKDDTFTNDKGEQVAYHKNTQPGVLIRGEFREPYTVRLEKGEQAFPIGEYELDVENMTTLNNGVLHYGKYTKLLPVAK